MSVCPGIECCPPSPFGSVVSTPLFYNTQQCYTSSCPQGTTGDDVTVCIDADTVSSTISQADANALALAQAVAAADAAIDCEVPSTTTYWNTEQCYTAHCPDGETGADVTVCIAVNTISSVISQQDANDLALAQATLQAEAALSCSETPPPTTYWNEEQCYTASCAVGQTGDDVTVCVAANTISSLVSVAAANSIALAQATQQATAGLICTAECLTLMPVMTSNVTSGYSVVPTFLPDRVGYECWRAFDGTGSWIPNAVPAPPGIIGAEQLQIVFPYNRSIGFLRIKMGTPLNGVACKVYLYGFNTPSVSGSPDSTILWNHSFTADSTNGNLIVFYQFFTCRALTMLVYKEASPFTQNVKYIEIFDCVPVVP